MIKGWIVYSLTTGIAAYFLFPGQITGLVATVSVLTVVSLMTLTDFIFTHKLKIA